MQIKFTAMKIKQLLITCSLLITGLFAAAQTAPPVPASESIDRGYIVKTGDQAPDDFKLVLANGTQTSLKELRGKIVVLQFTASWCSVCRTEMPYLEQDLWQAYKNKDVVLIGVDRDEPLEKVQRFQREMNITYPLALDPGANIFARFANKKAGVTRNVVIDKDGKIAYLTRLYDTQEFASMLKAIDTLVNNKTASIN